MRTFRSTTATLGHVIGERTWTPIVADAASQILRAHGVSVARLPADFPGEYRVAAAVFIHFDGSNPPCGSRASIGYHHRATRPPLRHGASYTASFGLTDFSRIILPKVCAIIMRFGK